MQSMQLPICLPFQARAIRIYHSHWHADTIRTNCAGRVLRATWYKRISFTFVPEATTVQSVYGEGVRPWTRPSNSCAE
jgi:hypothetical protein